jgi:hypothetical protein
VQAILKDQSVCNAELTELLFPKVVTLAPHAYTVVRLDPTGRRNSSGRWGAACDGAATISNATVRLKFGLVAQSLREADAEIEKLDNEVADMQDGW